VTFDFSVKEAIKQETVTTDYSEPLAWIDWVYDPSDPQSLVPKLGVDKDDIPIVIWLPKFLADKSHVSCLLKIHPIGRCLLM
jgi:hypothetical protein